MGILPELLVVGASKGAKRREEGRVIQRRDKFPKRMLITLAKIWAEESMACLFGTI